VDLAALPSPEKEPRSVGMDPVTGYAQTLRVIGQALENLNLGDFTVEPDSDGYHVTGSSPAAKSERDSWTVGQPIVPVTAIQLSYSWRDVERLEGEGRIQRATVHSAAASSRLSQALRVIGSYLTKKYSRLVRVSRKGEIFEVHYESSLGSRYSEQFSAADLYDLWVRFYLQRSVRTA
jgi:hypothetical protein